MTYVGEVKHLVRIALVPLNVQQQTLKSPESRVVQSTIKLTEGWPTVFYFVLLPCRQFFFLQIFLGLR